MRVTITEAAETVLDFDPKSENVLAPTMTSERAAALEALCGALAVVAGLEGKLTPREPGGIHSAQPTYNISATERTVTLRA